MLNLLNNTSLTSLGTPGHDLSTRKYDFLENTDRRACSGWGEGNRDLISSLQQILGPATNPQLARTTGFGSPMDDVAVVVLYVEIDLAMWVGPRKFRDNSRQGDVSKSSK